MRHGEVAVARARRPHGRRRRVEADWFVCAMPAERARKLWSRAGAAPPTRSSSRMDDLFVDWMNGIQFYLRKPVDIVRGHITFIDAPWALTALTQGQFWAERDFPRDYGDGKVADCLSVDISDWDTPGIALRQAGQAVHARTRSPARCWTQIKPHLDDTGDDVLPDDIMHSWFLDPGIRWHPARGRNSNATPLLVNTVGSWEKRPQAQTKIPNLFLAGDYVQTDIDLATMEGANESGRAAVNALLDAAGLEGGAGPRCTSSTTRPSSRAEAGRRELYKQGQPNALDSG